MRVSERGFFGGLAADLYGAPGDGPPLVLLHGLSFDRRQWDPVLENLAVLAPERQVVSFDLPGHGNSPRRDSYRLPDVAAVVHGAVSEAGLAPPVVVGHSLGGALATAYAGAYPAAGVVNIDQPLLAGPFAQLLRQAEGDLRGTAWEEVWNRLFSGMRTELLPPAAQDLIRTTMRPRQDLLLGYWSELLDTSADELAEERAGNMRAIRENGVAYHHVAGEEVPPGYRRWLEGLLPDVSVITLPGGGHFPHLGRPAELAALLAG
ncbi:alpha/beta fold hydrolase [Streptomyces sp. TS71-3]|uniref:alpha/beta fold hydrolase n=1 Tax=Streptomyces sp. TS71-3 TaxID=2733862 RepID=UPI001B29B8D8|nr:alpha/beta hydrolase [Streptomyces sp. TS71-3]GHJ37110.1 alpha/beta hydrolase [Streptomyces sp. TS71-3]